MRRLSGPALEERLRSITITLETHDWVRTPARRALVAERDDINRELLARFLHRRRSA